jgi:hypothetical protein
MAPAGLRAGADSISISGRNDNIFIPAFLPDQFRQEQLHLGGHWLEHSGKLLGLAMPFGLIAR